MKPKPITHYYKQQYGDAPMMKLSITGLEATALYKYSRKAALDIIGHMVSCGETVNPARHGMKGITLKVADIKYKTTNFGHYPIVARVEVTEED